MKVDTYSWKIQARNQVQDCFPNYFKQLFQSFSKQSFTEYTHGWPQAECKRSQPQSNSNWNQATDVRLLFTGCIHRSKVSSYTISKFYRSLMGTWEDYSRSKGEVKVSLCHDGVWGSGYIDPRFLDLKVYAEYLLDMKCTKAFSVIISQRSFLLGPTHRIIDSVANQWLLQDELNQINL
jgi:hypothetical protein